jgi:hypothetical protein
MAGLRERLRRLEEKGAKPVDLMCPECKAVIRVYDERVLRLEFLTYLWAPKRRREENGQEPSAEVLWLADHEHDPSAFVNKATGEPWLGEFFHGTSQMWLEEAEDLSEQRGRAANIPLRRVRGHVHSRREKRTFPPDTLAAEDLAPPRYTLGALLPSSSVAISGDSRGSGAASSSGTRCTSPAIMRLSSALASRSAFN